LLTISAFFHVQMTSVLFFGVVLISIDFSRCLYEFSKSMISMDRPISA
jgi:hypothetical protein